MKLFVFLFMYATSTCIDVHPHIFIYVYKLVTPVLDYISKPSFLDQESTIVVSAYGQLLAYLLSVCITY